MSEHGTPETEWQRKRRLAEVFGETLPETTRDEQTTGEDAPGSAKGDTWLQEQVPPHHGKV